MGRGDEIVFAVGEVPPTTDMIAAMRDFEKLGVFYLGRETGASAKEAEKLVLYDSRDLVTHAVSGGRRSEVRPGRNPVTKKLEALALRPKKSNISVRLVALAWAPFRKDGTGAVPAWR